MSVSCTKLPQNTSERAASIDGASDALALPNITNKLHATVAKAGLMCRTNQSLSLSQAAYGSSDNQVILRSVTAATLLTEVYEGYPDAAEGKHQLNMFRRSLHQRILRLASIRRPPGALFFLSKNENHRQVRLARKFVQLRLPRGCGRRSCCRRCLVVGTVAAVPIVVSVAVDAAGGAPWEALTMEFSSSTSTHA